MASILYSRKPLIIVFIGLLISTAYMTYYFTTEAIIWGTVASVALLLYIWAYTSKHVDLRDSISAIVLASIFLVVGGVIGVILHGSIGAVFYTLGLLVLSLGIVYSLTKYLL